MTEKAYAKINLTLDVVGKRPDGYHLLESVMTGVSLCDTVSVEKAGGISVFCSEPRIPTDGRNTCYKAAELFFEHTGTDGGAKIAIEKHIPSEAGLGGGSSDAAAVLRALNELYDARLSYEALEKIASKVGADVAFCISGRTAVCRGIGDDIIPLPPLEKRYALLVKPDFGISTPEAYRLFDARGMRSELGTKKFTEALERGENPYLCLSNDLEAAAANIETARIRMELFELGAEAAQMTGSGSCVFGLFSDRELAERAERIMKKSQPFVFLGETL